MSPGLSLTKNSSVLLQLTIPVRVQGYWRDVIVTECLSRAQAGRQRRSWLSDLWAHAHRRRPGQQRLCGGPAAVRSQTVCRITNTFGVLINIIFQVQNTRKLSSHCVANLELSSYDSVCGCILCLKTVT